MGRHISSKLKYSRHPLKDVSRNRPLINHQDTVAFLSEKSNEVNIYSGKLKVAPDDN